MGDIENLEGQGGTSVIDIFNMLRLIDEEQKAVSRVLGNMNSGRVVELTVLETLQKIASAEENLHAINMTNVDAKDLITKRQKITDLLLLNKTDLGDIFVDSSYLAGVVSDLEKKVGEVTGKNVLLSAFRYHNAKDFDSNVLSKIKVIQELLEEFGKLGTDIGKRVVEIFEEANALYGLLKASDKIVDGANKRVNI